MDSSSSAGRCTELAGSKRVQCLPFPGGFEELIINLLADRSAFLRTQRECVADAGGDACIDLPAEVTSDWLYGLISTTAALIATDDSKLVECLKASAFFQDSGVVKKLACLLGSRLFKAGTEEEAVAGASNAAQHSCAQRERLQVLEELPADLAMDVLHSAPVALSQQLLHLPHSLRPLAVLAECPGLAASCSPAPECSESDLPVLTVCVDTRQAQAAEPDILVSNNDAANAELWLHATDDHVENVQNGMFSLEHRAGTIACRLLANSRRFQGLRVVLPDSTCVVFGPTSGALHLKNITFQGGSIVCMGSDCNVTFADVAFESCTLIVRAGAQATLERPRFNHTDTTRLSVYAHGAGSQVVVTGGTICGGAQGVAVYAGAHLHASDLTITQVGLVGVEVRDGGSNLNLTGCKLHDFHPCALYGVHVHASSKAHLSTLSISGMHRGVNIRAHASATLVDCNVAHASVACVGCTDGGRGYLEGCTLSDSEVLGLYVSGVGASAEATNCHFLQNAFNGADVTMRGMLKANTCRSSGNSSCGYAVRGNGSVLELADCTSSGGHMGVRVFKGTLTAHKVEVIGAEEHGVFVVDGGQAVLRECIATKCRGTGIVVRGGGSRLDAECSTLQQNCQYGAFAMEGAVAMMRACHSSGNQIAGYCAQAAARMTVINSSSEDDEKDCAVRYGGHLTLEGLTVDGVLKSGIVAEESG